jgi:molybdopterin synthase catalytic subunit
MSYFVDLIYDQIEPKIIEYTQKVSADKAGAITTFLGTTRNYFEDKHVTKLVYTCYEDMARSEMENICKRALSQTGICNVLLVHRLGEVPIGEASIICLVASEHRKEGYSVNIQMMEELKHSVPIWKEEFYTIGEKNWKENTV